MPVIDLTGVIEVRGVRAASVPKNTRTTLRLIKGATTSIFVKVLNSDGTPFSPAGQTVRLAIRKRINSAAVFDSTVTTPQTDGTFLFSMVPTTFRNDPGGAYLYEVAVITTVGGATQPIIPLSPCFIEEAIVPIP